jgi:hypothetical protein
MPSSMQRRPQASWAESLSVGCAVLVIASLGHTQQVRDVTITGMDYAFGVPATIRPGLTAFTFENQGTVWHEMYLIRLKPGVSLDSLRRVPAGPQRRPLIEGGGILLAGPGQRSTDRLLVDLKPGQTYTLICNFRDEPDKPPHLEMGMFAHFQAR